VKLVPVAGPDYTAACQWMLSAITGRKLAITPHPALDDAAEAAVKRVVSDAWVWGRRTAAVSLAPLVAANMAGWASLHPSPRAPRSVMVMPS